MNESFKKWELWATIALNTIAGLQIGGVIPESGKLHVVVLVIGGVLTNMLALVGRQVIRGKRSRAGDVIGDATPTVPVTMPAKRKRAK